ncbi:MAG: hypothetical protein EXS01_05410 [Phycisphaerales bacterium]|nr:hypothetical protein [Phycisphaerales bacterium]
MSDGQPEMRVMILLVEHGKAFDTVINSVLDAGISDATIVESQSLASVMRQDMPIFAGLAALLPQSAGARAIIILCDGSRASTLMGYLKEIPKDDRPIAASFVVDHFLGFDS